jgi:phosphate-selective porin OprO and OprP
MRAVRFFIGWLTVGICDVAAVPHLLGQQNGSATSQVADTLRSSLEARIDGLEQQIRELQLRKLALDSAADAVNGRPTVTADGKDGFGVKSADGKYSMRFRGYLHSDGRLFLRNDAAPLSDNFLIRRARPVIEVAVGQYFGFRLMPDFGGSSPTVFDAYWEGKFTPAFTVRAGKFKPPIGLERLQSATDITFAERGLPSNLVPSRDIGLQIAGDLSRGAIAYQVGVFSGVPDLANGGDDLSDAKDFVARIFLQPFSRGRLQGLGVGVAGSTGIERGSPAVAGLAAYRTPGQQTFFRYRGDPANSANTVFADGTRVRLSPQGHFYIGPLGLLGELILSRQEIGRGAIKATLDHTAWQASGSLFLTGERAGFRSPAPDRPFDLSARGLGAVELVARYGRLNVDDAAFPVFADHANSAQKVEAWGIGLNWHLVRAVKLAVNYEHATFTGGAAAGDRESENVVITRFQHAF